VSGAQATTYRDSIKDKKPCLGDQKLGATPAKRIAPVFALMTLDRNRSETAARERQAIFLGETEPRTARPGSRPRCGLSRRPSVVAVNRSRPASSP
jgi:hypothetical protein